jgi:hypothetical protein
VTRYQWSGRLTLSVPPEQAFIAFTPRGECGWAPEWNPVFHGPAEDDSAPGTVFEILHGNSRSVWQVVDRTDSAYLRYARTTPGISVGTVTVELRPEGTGSRVDVTYRMTALSSDGEAHLTAQSTDPDESPSTWQEPIEQFLTIQHQTLDVDTGGGEVLAEAPRFPPRLVGRCTR